MDTRSTAQTRREEHDAVELADFRLIGRGPASTVYAATERATGRRVALKLLHDWDPGEEQWTEFRRSVDATNRLAARVGVVSVIRIERSAAGTPFVVMPLLEARSLGALLKRRGPMTGGEIVGIGEAVTGALAAAHAEAMIHGAVKPTNLLLSRGGAVLLGDFGAATTASSRPVSAHAAPELLDGGQSEAGDVYALASTLYELVQGHPPYRAKGTRASTVMTAKRSGALPAEPDLIAESSIREALMAALDPDPARRPSAAELQGWFGECDMSPWFDADRPVPVIRFGPPAADPFASAAPAPEHDDPETEPAAVVRTASAIVSPPPVDPGADDPVDRSPAAPPLPVVDLTERRERRMAIWIGAAAAAIALLVGVNAVVGGRSGDDTPNRAAANDTPPLTTAFAATTSSATLDGASSSSSSSSVVTTTSSLVTSSAPPVTTVAATAVTTRPITPTTARAATSTTLADDEPASTTIRLAGPPTLPPPTTGPPLPTSPTATTPASVEEPVPVTTLPPATAAPTTVPPRPTVGNLSVTVTSNGVRAVANSGDRCASSAWVLSGPVSKEQSSTAPPNCFTTAHAFDTEWYQLDLTPGSYSIRLTLTNAAGSASTSSSFVVT